MFSLKFGHRVRRVSKIRASEFTSRHREIIEQVGYRKEELLLPQPDWLSTYLGAGEEKAVFCICDPRDRVFALELIDERHYLDGRFVGGEYFCETRAGELANLPATPNALVGLTFTGLVKAREYVHGYEWSRFQFDPQRSSPLDGLLTAYLRLFLTGKMRAYRARYEDVHGRNVLFEIREPGERGVPALAREWSGGVRALRVGLQPIDVR
jgi:hypothetical protein